ncbi:MAG: YedE-related selenium metabolism membrane protein [Tissierellia bacterium]|nr:YedE-related selenium metabolism membrane protein [Tissierellia bacterium]
MMDKEKRNIILAGLAIGIIAVGLVVLGNPANMGFCIACFIRDIAGAVGIHRAAPVQYIRPEIVGLVLGAFFMSIGSKEFKTRGNSSPVTRFVIGFFVTIGALVFLGCPFRMILRLAGGDLNALIGLAGFAAGIAVGMVFLKKGYSLERTYKLPKQEGYIFPLIQVVLFILLVTAPAFIFFTEAGKGPGGAHAPIYISLAAGLIVGVLAQRTRMCMIGGIRDIMLFKEGKLLVGFIAVFVSALIMNIVTKKFNLGFEGQPIAHTDALWNFLGLSVVGFGSTLLGGCPLRQLIMAGEGNSDSVITVLGLFVGAAFAHNFSLAASGEGVPLNGKIAVIIALVVLFAIAAINTKKIKSK